MLRWVTRIFSLALVVVSVPCLGAADNAAGPWLYLFAVLGALFALSIYVVLTFLTGHLWVVVRMAVGYVAAALLILRSFVFYLAICAHLRVDATNGAAGLLLPFVVLPSLVVAGLVFGAETVDWFSRKNDRKRSLS